jgi:Zn-dependent peptidase ImmA (M78 family)
MIFRRGFKAEANAYARDLRRELGLAAHTPLCQWRLAEHLGYRIVPVSSVKDNICGQALYLMSPRGRREFSAITLQGPFGPLIVHNDTHDLKRQAANLAHESAHGLLHHKAQPLFEDGARAYNKEMEEEASWLGAALLISDEAALLIVQRGYSLEEASDRYGASVELIRWRLNVCAAFRRAA